MFIALLFSSVFSLLSIAEWPEYSEEALTDEQKQHIIQENKLSYLKKEPEKDALKRIDVNEKGEILCTLESWNSPWRTVCVYSDEGVFRFGYRFYETGEFGACWQGDDILLFSSHSYIAMLMDRQGHYKDIRALTYSSENSVYMGVPVKTEFSANGDTYTLKSRYSILRLSNTYSQIVKTSENGEQRVIYDASNRQEKSVLLIVLAVVIIVTAAVVGVVVTFVRLKKGKMQMYQSIPFQSG